MSHILFEIIYSDEKVSVTGFQAIAMEKLFDKLDVADIGPFTLYLHTDSIIERCQQAKWLQYPSEVFVDEATIALILVLLETRNVICSVIIALWAKVGQLLLYYVNIKAFC